LTFIKWFQYLQFRLFGYGIKLIKTVGTWWTINNWILIPTPDPLKYYFLIQFQNFWQMDKFKHRSRCFGNGRPWFIFLMLDTLFDFSSLKCRPVKVNITCCWISRDVWVLQTSKTDNNALDIDVIYNLKLNTKHTH
jgi:hypothetical protein